MIIGIFFRRWTNRKNAIEVMHRIANKYFNTDESLKIEFSTWISMTCGKHSVRMYFVDENKHSRGNRFHKIYVDRNFSQDFIKTVLLPTAHLYHEVDIERMELL